MTTLPDPSSIDFTAIAGWASGIALVVTSVGVVIWRAIANAGKIADRLPAPVTTTNTKIITTDSVAMHELAATLEASNTILSENNILRREEHADREANRRVLQANTDTMERAIAVINEARSDLRELDRQIVRLVDRLKP